KTNQRCPAKHHCQSGDCGSTGRPGGQRCGSCRLSWRRIAQNWAQCCSSSGCLRGGPASTTSDCLGGPVRATVAKPARVSASSGTSRPRWLSSSAVNQFWSARSLATPKWQGCAGSASRAVRNSACAAANQPGQPAADSTWLDRISRPEGCPVIAANPLEMQTGPTGRCSRQGAGLGSLEIEPTATIGSYCSKYCPLWSGPEDHPIAPRPSVRATPDRPPTNHIYYFLFRGIAK